METYIFAVSCSTQASYVFYENIMLILLQNFPRNQAFTVFVKIDVVKFIYFEAFLVNNTQKLIFQLLFEDIVIGVHYGVQYVLVMGYHWQPKLSNFTALIWLPGFK